MGVCTHVPTTTGWSATSYVYVVEVNSQPFFKSNLVKRTSIDFSIGTWHLRVDQQLVTIRDCRLSTAVITLSNQADSSTRWTL